jgi:PBP1b-binding outer membrane lipoprotein LpoB
VFKDKYMKKLVMMLLVTLSISGCAGVGIATVGAVMYYKSQSHEVASVDIEAPAQNVYQVAIDVVNKNPAVTISNQDDTMYMLDLQQNDNSGSIKITAINSKLSKLTITSNITGENEETPLSGIFKICEELQVKCELSK